MNLEWIITGIVLFGAIIVCGSNLYLKRRKEQNLAFDKSNDFRI
jgi:Na+-transporting NADH:ubiquinone oxidoreductase subunit NqrC